MTDIPLAVVLAGTDTTLLAALLADQDDPDDPGKIPADLPEWFAERNRTRHGLESPVPADLPEPSIPRTLPRRNP